jgi:ABC-type dipeptide/oligopeptide/nickel transport system permease component
MKMTLSHFEATMLLALLISVVLGVVTKRNDRERLRYGLTSFGYFVITVFGLSWLMYLGHR